ncbi:hypothetical protein C8R44DRAFT_725961 [Mycena epipterygia]|nr:hypothetical protein C8R44DRAFT_725961 [Mycena epipterygia]
MATTPPGGMLSLLRSEPHSIWESSFSVSHWLIRAALSPTLRRRWRRRDMLSKGREGRRSKKMPFERRVGLDGKARQSTASELSVSRGGLWIPKGTGDSNTVLDIRKQDSVRPVIACEGCKKRQRILPRQTGELDATDRGFWIHAHAVSTTTCPRDEPFAPHRTVSLQRLERSFATGHPSTQRVFMPVLELFNMPS